MEILNKGEFQVSDLEREEQIETAVSEVANIITQKCVSKETGKPFPVSIIKKAMNDLNINVTTSKSSKKQALDIIKRLTEVLPIERAKIKVRIHTPQNPVQ